MVPTKRIRDVGDEREDYVTDTGQVAQNATR
jgi:hypothetical protein